MYFPRLAFSTIPSLAYLRIRQSVTFKIFPKVFPEMVNVEDVSMGLLTATRITPSKIENTRLQQKAETETFQKSFL